MEWHSGDSGSHLLANLRTLATQRRAHAVLLVIFYAISAGLAAVLIGAALIGFGIVSFDPVPFALVLGAAVLVAGLWWLLAREQTLSQLAFGIDGRAGFDQRYGTAIELAMQDARKSGPVARALLLSAVDDDRTVQDLRLGRLITRQIFIAGVLTLVLAGLVMLRPFPGGSSVGGAPSEAPTVADSNETLLAGGAQAAELIAFDAEALQNRYLSSVAEALRARIEAPVEGADPNALRADLEGLLAHAVRAYDNSVPDWLRGDDEADRLEGLSERIAQFYADQAEAQSLQTSAQPARNGELDWNNASRFDIDTDSLAGGGDVEWLSEEELQRLAQERLQTADAPMDAAAGPGTGAPPTEAFPMPSQETAEGFWGIAGVPDNAGQPVGAALQPGRGLNNASGLGTQALAEDAAFENIEGVSATQDMMIETSLGPGGRRIRMEVIPEAANGTGENFVQLDGSGGLPSSGSVVARQMVPAERLAVTARYFARTLQ